MTDSGAVETGTLARLRQVCDAATPGPWYGWSVDNNGASLWGKRDSVGLPMVLDTTINTPSAADRELILAAVNAVRALLDIAEAARESLPKDKSYWTAEQIALAAALSVLDQEAQPR